MKQPCLFKTSCCVPLRMSKLSPFVSAGPVCLLPAFSLFQYAVKSLKWMTHPYYNCCKVKNIINRFAAGVMLHIKCDQFTCFGIMISELSPVSRCECLGLHDSPSIPTSLPFAIFVPVAAERNKNLCSRLSPTCLPVVSHCFLSAREFGWTNFLCLDSTCHHLSLMTFASVSMLSLGRNNLDCLPLVSHLSHLSATSVSVLWLPCLFACFPHAVAISLMLFLFAL